MFKGLGQRSTSDSWITRTDSCTSAGNSSPTVKLRGLKNRHELAASMGGMKHMDGPCGFLKKLKGVSSQEIPR